MPPDLRSGRRWRLGATASSTNREDQPPRKPLATRLQDVRAGSFASPSGTGIALFANPPKAHLPGKAAPCPARRLVRVAARSSRAGSRGLTPRREVSEFPHQLSLPAAPRACSSGQQLLTSGADRRFGRRVQ